MLIIIKANNYLKMEVNEEIHSFLAQSIHLKSGNPCELLALLVDHKMKQILYIQLFKWA